MASLVKEYDHWLHHHPDPYDEMHEDLLQLPSSTPPRFGLCAMLKRMGRCNHSGERQESLQAVGTCLDSIDTAVIQTLSFKCSAYSGDTAQASLHTHTDAQRYASQLPFPVCVACVSTWGEHTCTVRYRAGCLRHLCDSGVRLI
jgi:hypothetical protein